MSFHSVCLNSTDFRDGIEKYLIDGKDFIDERKIWSVLNQTKNPDKQYILDILEKSKAIEQLAPEETAALMNVTDPELWQLMAQTGLAVKQKVYDSRIVFFAPLYCSNLCINGCSYCGFSSDNAVEKRRALTLEEIESETTHVLDEGHKRMIVVFGEHPVSGVEYICNTLNAIYGVSKKTIRNTTTSIRRINVNAAPMSVEHLRALHDVGIGTYQVFQETYGLTRYKEVHRWGPKANYRWRLYALHRAMDAGVDDVGAGVLLGLYNWKYDVLGLLYHAADLVRQFGIGPHTVSVPRLNPASGVDLSFPSKYRVDDEQFKRITTVLRLAIPYSGLIVTAREKADVRMAAIELGCTQTDASSKIGVGAYAEKAEQKIDHQQFMLGDTRSLDSVVHQLANRGMITSFCTAGYRCGRTGKKIMSLLHSGVEGKFCKLNAVLTYREYLDDYASPDTKAAGEKVIAKELAQIDNMSFYNTGNLRTKFIEHYAAVCEGERDIYI